MKPSFETNHITISDNENSHFSIKQEPPIDRNLSDPLEMCDAGEYLLKNGFNERMDFPKVKNRVIISNGQIV